MTTRLVEQISEASFAASKTAQFRCTETHVNSPSRQQFLNALVAQLPSLRRYAIALVGNVAVADDLVQDCIERAINKSSQLRDEARLQSWVRRILYNLYMDEIHRTRARGMEVQISDFADDLQLSSLPSDRAVTSELVRAIGKLNPEHRQILLLVGLEQLNYRELAEELAIPIGTVMSRLARAREQLRAELEETSIPENVVLFRTDKRVGQ